MRFGHRLPQDTATLLLVSLFVIVIIGLAIASGDQASHHVEGLSTVGAICLLVVYGTWTWGYLRSATAEEESGVHEDRARIAFPFAVLLLAVAGVGAAFVSDWFIHALDPAVESLGISKAFAGLVIVAIAGNAVENFSGILFASRGQSDLAISIVKNSVAQIAAFLFPALVLVSLLFATSLTFALAPVYIGALFLTAIASGRSPATARPRCSKASRWSRSTWCWRRSRSTTDDHFPHATGPCQCFEQKIVPIGSYQRGWRGGVAGPRPSAPRRWLRKLSISV